MNHANLSGTLPLVKFVGVTKLYMYSNDGLVGSLPTSLGTLLPNLETLYLQDTSLEGTIPSELGFLTNMRELLLDHTHLAGSMPSEICALSSLENVHADCKGDPPHVSCDCCTKCH
jgi:Leucine-rich repeat (LRR) protein